MIDCCKLLPHIRRCGELALHRSDAAGPAAPTPLVGEQHGRPGRATSSPIPLAAGRIGGGGRLLAAEKQASSRHVVVATCRVKPELGQETDDVSQLAGPELAFISAASRSPCGQVLLAVGEGAEISGSRDAPPSGASMLLAAKRGGCARPAAALWRASSPRPQM